MIWLQFLVSVFHNFADDIFVADPEALKHGFRQRTTVKSKNKSYFSANFF